MRQLLPTIFLGVASCELIYITLLYEKIEGSPSRQITSLVVKDSIAFYSSLVREAGLELTLSNVYDYGTYSKLDKYEELSYLAGTAELHKRLEQIERLDENVIMLVSSNEPVDTEKYNKMGLCRSRYFVDIGMGMNTASAILDGFKKWLSEVTGVDMTTEDKEELKRRIQTIDIDRIRKMLEECRESGSKGKSNSPDETEYPNRRGLRTAYDMPGSAREKGTRGKEASSDRGRYGGYSNRRHKGSGQTITNEKTDSLESGPARNPESKLKELLAGSKTDNSSNARYFSTVSPSSLSSARRRVEIS